MVYDFIVVGATGIQGRIATKDLLQNGYSVMLAGRDRGRVENILRKHKKTAFSYLDLRDKNSIPEVIKNSGAIIAINCAEGDFNVDVLKACIKAGANHLDLGSEEWMTKEQFKLGKALRDRGLVSITGCGSTPGIVSVMAGYASGKLDNIKTIEAGFAWDSNMDIFVVPYSIDTIVEEFTYKAPIMKNGKKEYVEPLSLEKENKLAQLGKKRSRCMMHAEIYTFNHVFKSKGVKNIVYYAYFPDHSFDAIMNMINLGLCSKDYIVVDGNKVRALDCLLEELKRLEIPKGYTEREDLWVDMTGKKNGREKKIRMMCTAGTLKGWEDATCNVDTGMPISIMAQMVKNGMIKAKGSFSPELVVPCGLFFSELARRKMYVYENGKKIN